MKNIMLLVFITLAATFTPIFAKVSVSEISPISFGFFRFGTAAILFYITLKARKLNLKFDKQDYPRLILLALLCIPLNQFFFLTGVKMSFASHSGIIYSLNPVYAYIVAVLIKYEKFYYSKLFSIMLTVIGIFFIFYENFSQTDVNPEVLSGDILLLFAVLTFSMYLTLGKTMIEKYGALKSSAFVFLLGTFFYIPLFIYDLPNLTFVNLTYKGILGYFYLAVIVAYITYFLWYYAIRRIAISKLTTFSNISPLLTVIFSIIFLGEHISLFFIIGSLITLAGVFIMHRVSIDIS
ncbi:MAG: EamA family transporter [Chlorobi bacterium]|nr:EamA family transporter [Chlorobiota bacterium]MCI0715015.1 EamA family transporter [Chlorobiota bacterium]